MKKSKHSWNISFFQIFRSHLVEYYSALLWKYLGLENTLCSVRSCFCGFKVVPIHSSEPDWGSWAGTKSRLGLPSRDQIQVQQLLENMIFVSLSQSFFNFLLLKLAIVAIKTRHGWLLQSFGLSDLSFCNKHLRLCYKSAPMLSGGSYSLY